MGTSMDEQFLLLRQSPVIWEHFWEGGQTIIGSLRVKEHCEIVSWKWGKERFIKTLSMSGRQQIVL